MSDTLEAEHDSFISLDRVTEMNIQSWNPGTIFLAQFRLVNRVHEYERRVYHFFDLLGDVGGFFEALYVLSHLVVGGIASRLLFASMIRDIFHVRIDTNKTDIKRLKTKLIRRNSIRPPTF